MNWSTLFSEGTIILNSTLANILGNTTNTHKTITTTLLRSSSAIERPAVKAPGVFYDIGIYEA